MRRKQSLRDLRMLIMQMNSKEVERLQREFEKKLSDKKNETAEEMNFCFTMVDFLGSLRILLEEHEDFIRKI